MTSRTFKERYYQHKHSMENSSFAEDDGQKGTRLSSKAWQLKKEGKPVQVNFKIANKAYTYSSGGKMCYLCISESTRILLDSKGPEPYPTNWELLNKRVEVLSKCRHKLKFKLASYK